MSENPLPEDTKNPLRCLLVPTDFSPVSKASQACACEIARRTAGECVLVHAIEPIRGLDPDTLEKFYRELEDKAAEAMGPVVQHFRDRGVPIEARILRGRRYEVILRCAEEEACDLIVIGTHRSKKGARPVIGTTSQKLFFVSTTPLLVVPAEPM